MEGKKGRHLDHNSARAPHTMTCGVWLSIQPLRIVQKLLCHCKVTYETSNAHLRLPVKAESKSFGLITLSGQSSLFATLYSNPKCVTSPGKAEKVYESDAYRET